MAEDEIMKCAFLSLHWLRNCLSMNDCSSIRLSFTVLVIIVWSIDFVGLTSNLPSLLHVSSIVWDRLVMNDLVPVLYHNSRAGAVIKF